ncbi:hypothetical protein CGRA01v4_00729 [Colletotrichum graminicola]|nr:hypothetical protein CGRA01v4_00729 [Colletotrichum graminicola]
MSVRVSLLVPLTPCVQFVCCPSSAPRYPLSTIRFGITTACKKAVSRVSVLLQSGSPCPRLAHPRLQDYPQSVQGGDALRPEQRATSRGNTVSIKRTSTPGTPHIFLAFCTTSVERP